MYWYYRDKLQIISIPGVLGFRKLYRVQAIKPRVKWEKSMKHFRIWGQETEKIRLKLNLIVVSRKKNKIAIFHYK